MEDEDIENFQKIYDTKEILSGEELERNSYRKISRGEDVRNQPFIGFLENEAQEI